MNQYSLLAHVAPGLTSQLENLATESLWYILRWYREAREAFIDLVSTMGYVGPSVLTFDTQFHMQEGGIPDLVGMTADETRVLFVESKFWATLTPNQPTSYLRQLPEDKEGMVLFIAPEGRYQTLWPELIARCQREGLELRGETKEPPNWHVVLTSKVRRLAYVSWSFALDHLEDQLKKAGQDRGAHEVWQLKGLCQRLDDPIPPQDTSDSDQRRKYLRSVVDDVVLRLSEMSLFDTSGYRATPGPHYYRRYGTFLDHVNWFIEYNEQNATHFGSSLLWAGGPSRDMSASEPLLAAEENPLRSYELNKEVLFPLNVPNQAERELVVQSLVTQAKVIAEVLRKRGRS